MRENEDIIRAYRYDCTDIECLKAILAVRDYFVSSIRVTLGSQCDEADQVCTVRTLEEVLDLADNGTYKYIYLHGHYRDVATSVLIDCENNLVNTRGTMKILLAADKFVRQEDRHG